MVVSSHEGPKQCVKDRFCVPKRGSKLPSVFGDPDDGYFTCNLCGPMILLQNDRRTVDCRLRCGGVGQGNSM